MWSVRRGLCQIEPDRSGSPRVVDRLTGRNEEYERCLRNSSWNAIDRNVVAVVQLTDTRLNTITGLKPGTSITLRRSCRQFYCSLMIFWKSEFGNFK